MEGTQLSGDVLEEEQLPMRLPLSSRDLVAEFFRKSLIHPSVHFLIDIRLEISYLIPTSNEDKYGMRPDPVDLSNLCC